MKPPPGLFYCVSWQAFFMLSFYIGRRIHGPCEESLILGIIRFITVSVLTFLLLGPLVRQIQNTIVDPAIVFVLDNSESITANYSDNDLENLKSTITQVIQEVRGEDFNVEVENLKGDTIFNLADMSYDLPVTNLSETLNDIENKYEGKNLQKCRYDFRWNL